MSNSNLAYEMEYREELIDGKIVAMSPRPGWNHISIAANIYNLFANYLHGKKCTAIPDGCDLFLTKEDRFVPDMMVVCDRDKIKTDGVHGAPDLVVEVLSKHRQTRPVPQEKCLPALRCPGVLDRGPGQPNGGAVFPGGRGPSAQRHLCRLPGLGDPADDRRRAGGHGDPLQVQSL